MPIPEYFHRVIQRTLSREPEQSTEQMAGKIIEALELAEAILGDAPAAPRPNLQVPRPTPSPGMIFTRPPVREIDLNQGMIIGAGKADGFSETVPAGASIIEEAPPSAVIRNADKPASSETTEEIEVKKAKLHGDILRSLPAHMTIELPGLAAPIRLERFVSPTPGGFNTIRVLYAQHQSEEDGPQVQLSTGDEPAFQGDAAGVKAFKDEILRQAAMRYRASRPRIEPRTPKSEGFPDIDSLQQRPNSSHGTDEVVPPEDVKEWNRLSALPSIIGN